MKRFLSFIHKTLFLLAVATISVAFEGCSEVADKTMDGIKDLPAQIIRMSTPEIAETVGSEKNMTPETAATEYNYIYFRYNNQWVTNKLISYEVVDDGQNIKFTVEGNSVASYYTSMDKCRAHAQRRRQHTHTEYITKTGGGDNLWLIHSEGNL